MMTAADLLDKSRSIWSGPTKRTPAVYGHRDRM